ncbi:GntR family transcriptional regulator [Microbacterium sp. zg-Y818]|uniref:GntR family transcriptional regulator n=1 Tax=unclassified Microbacterium TaxID=2609290 RepID=UPI00214B314C|nr:MULTISPECIES: GntR family transcriptional regulator [unclassified Microbacterium]MCR2800225.1 GntR family transcriptional regulator [Microbacterium sp. zg.Y818]WIM22192.1 GntR family transcriptional regulator [Microbacterium sp. zg-Y818]
MVQPKYLEILDALRSRSSGLPIGARLAPERALAEEFGVSVMTVRRSLGQLAAEGWVKKIPGSGTYVSRPTVSMGPALTSFTQDMRQRGFTPSSQVMRSETITPDVETIGVLDLRPGESAVLVERLRYADNEPMCHEVSVFRPQFAPLLLGVDLSGSVHERLATKGFTPMSTERVVRAVLASNRECELLQLPRGYPALEIVDTFFDTLGRPIQHVRSRYRFDRYEVRTDINRG